MKTIRAIVLPILLLLCVSTLVGKKEDSQTAAPTRVVVLRCSLNGATYMVTAVSGVAGTPAVTIGENCAQALTDHLNAGFAMNSTQLEPASASLVYTLVNAPSNGN